ncbi:hypothetical protein SCL_0217 [Sulfuricaulis limicola]|uniref:Transporter n=1 Tax=Sulfuricaulis limicola TaxID=1620215 RepID=A0A1B4XCK9_9GAMM|nr:transporter [Sulfuricaulis limicola]BAV32539.1 hypothetical protein SCL_0217 [Sulfuricaulis limicola]
MKSKILSACALISFIGLFTALAAHASCGAAFCTLNTHWESQGAWTGTGMRLDLRYEYIDLDQPLAGRERVPVGALPRHHDETRTLNRNLVATLDYSISADWGVSVTAPWVDRRHWHIHNHHGAQLPESWDISELGDMRVTARHGLASDGESLNTHGVILGLKLPTGKTDVVNDDGDPAERTLQPGSGTTDAIIGMYLNGPLNFGTQIASGFLQAQVQYPLNARDDFRPGNQYLFDLGMSYPLSPAWSGLMQLNTQIKDRDRGGEAEPLDSGGSFVWLSPGLSYTLSRAARIYGFVQLPLYQRVNGLQLTPGWTAAAGASWRF